MRRRLTVLMALLTVVGSSVFGAGAASAAPLTHTQRTVVRPVTASGHAAPGFTVTTEPGMTVDCSFPDPSPAAVDPDILYCSPNAAYALACWRSAAKHHVLCLRDAAAKTLVSLQVSSTIARAKPYRLRAPLNLRLGNGLFCELRDGGAASSLRGHPNYVVVYYCTHGQAVWAPVTASDAGINRAPQVWRVKVAPANGNGPLVGRSVARAWFVGTRH